jgi:Sec7-like guanine-nucleotide exchange factor
MKPTFKETLELSYYAGIEEMVYAIENVILSDPYPKVTLDNFYEMFKDAMDNWYSVDKMSEIMCEHGFFFNEDIAKAYIKGVYSFQQRLIEANENSKHLFDDPEDDGDELIENILSWLSVSAKSDVDIYVDSILAEE